MRFLVLLFAILALAVLASSASPVELIRRRHPEKPSPPPSPRQRPPQQQGQQQQQRQQQRPPPRQQQRPQEIQGFGNLPTIRGGRRNNRPPENGANPNFYQK
ncbi:hypothetical protein DFJ73DRAFT_965948 [Zopfochytrium polystomum]|nr:hypothetical protein DFJ73DRAFT_965948 [Zopfochytrium polystomum]